MKEKNKELIKKLANCKSIAISLLEKQEQLINLKNTYLNEGVDKNILEGLLKAQKIINSCKEELAIEFANEQKDLFINKLIKKTNFKRKRTLPIEKIDSLCSLQTEVAQLENQLNSEEISVKALSQTREQGTQTDEKTNKSKKQLGVKVILEEFEAKIQQSTTYGIPSSSKK